MTFNEYFATGCDNYHSEFTFHSGEKASGVITQFFPHKPVEFYLIRSNDLIMAKELSDANDYEGLSTLAAKVDLNDLKSASRIFINHN